MVRTILIVGALGAASILLAAAWTQRDLDPAKYECFNVPYQTWYGAASEKRICVLRPWIDDRNQRY